MRFSHSENLFTQIVDGIPRPDELTNKFSQEEERAVMHILAGVSEFLRFHGVADRQTYIIPLPRIDAIHSERLFGSRLEKVVMRTAEVLSDHCDWDVEFTLDVFDVLKVVLRSGVANDNTPEVDDIDQLDLF